MKLIETSHGTVCEHCRLWPDLCNCGSPHPLLSWLFAQFGARLGGTIAKRPGAGE